MQTALYAPGVLFKIRQTLKRRIHIWLLLCCVGLALLGGRARGSDEDLAATAWSMRIWHSADGLPSDSVTAIIQTRDGFIWVDTSAGLVWFDGVKFTRQVAITHHIVDFAARSRRMIIAIDGDTHGRQVEYDAARTQYLERQGYRVIRFTNGDVMGNPEGVIEAIGVALAAASPLSTPLPAGEREQ